jgi:hypothetical protein
MPLDFSVRGVARLAHYARSFYLTGETGFPLLWRRRVPRLRRAHCPSTCRAPLHQSNARCFITWMLVLSFGPMGVFSSRAEFLLRPTDRLADSRLLHRAHEEQHDRKCDDKAESGDGQEYLHD